MIQAINPKLIPEARQLLEHLYQVQGQVTLAGQHNYLGRMSTMSDQMASFTGKNPAVWGTDFGFSGTPGDIDYLGDRVKLFAEIQKQHQQGAIIVMTYHQGNPLIGEPCEFKGGVQSPMSPAQWQQLLSPGTSLHAAWCAQMDLLADLFQRLQSAKIPVIFRPYHEMNGDWFWWGKYPGPQGYTGLWKQTFDYFTHKHQLNNLLWAWCSDRPWPGVEDYYPGHDVVDILGADIYPLADRPEVYPQEWYDRMATLAQGRILALSENSVIPSATILEKQPWSWFMAWADLPYKMHTEKEMRSIFATPRIQGLP